MLHAQPPGRERFAGALRRNRSLETLQRGGIPQAWDVLEDRRAPIAVWIGEGCVHQPVWVGFLP